MATEARLRANKKYMEKAYDQLQFRVRKETHFNERLDIAAKKTNKSKVQYVIDAVEKAMVEDGVTLDNEE